MKGSERVWKSLKESEREMIVQNDLQLQKVERDAKCAHHPALQSSNLPQSLIYHVYIVIYIWLIIFICVLFEGSECPCVVLAENIFVLLQCVRTVRTVRGGKLVGSSGSFVSGSRRGFSDQRNLEWNSDGKPLKLVLLVLGPGLNALLVDESLSPFSLLFKAIWKACNPPIKPRTQVTLHQVIRSSSPRTITYNENLDRGLETWLKRRAAVLPVLAFAETAFLFSSTCYLFALYLVIDSGRCDLITALQDLRWQGVWRLQLGVLSVKFIEHLHKMCSGRTFQWTAGALSFKSHTGVRNRIHGFEERDTVLLYESLWGIWFQIVGFWCTLFLGLQTRTARIPSSA